MLTSTPGDDGTVVVSWSQPGDSSSDVNTSLFQLVNGTATPIYQPSDGPSGSTSVSSVGAASQVFAISETAEQGASSYYSNFIDIPPTIPATPANLSATPYSDGTGSGIRLLWDNTPDNETGFTVQRSTSAEFSTDLQSFTVDADVTSYVDSADASNDDSVQPGTTYYYRVEATNDAGDSGFSNTVSAAVALPTVSVTAIDPNANFAAPDGKPQDAWLDFHRSGDDTAALTANVTYAGTATVGTDYSKLPAQVTFDAGQPDVIVPVVPVNTTPGASSVVAATVGPPTEANFVPGGVPADVNVAIHGLAISLDGGTTGDVFVDSPDGREHLQPLTFTIPQNAAPGTRFTLSVDLGHDANAANVVEVWTPAELDNQASDPLLGGGYASYTWTVGADASVTPPSTLYVGAIGGSRISKNVTFSISEVDPTGSSDPTTAPAVVPAKTSSAVFEGRLRNGTDLSALDDLLNTEGVPGTPFEDEAAYAQNYLSTNVVANLGMAVTVPQIKKIALYSASNPGGGTLPADTEEIAFQPVMMYWLVYIGGGPVHLEDVEKQTITLSSQDPKVDGTTTQPPGKDGKTTEIPQAGGNMLIIPIPNKPNYEYVIYVDAPPALALKKPIGTLKPYSQTNSVQQTVSVVLDGAQGPSRVLDSESFNTVVGYDLHGNPTSQVR